jgi:hypothetical protein
MAYAWDSTALSGAGNFVVLTSSTVINPLDAIFVQLITTAPQSIPIVYSTALGVAPTKNVHATLSGSYSGWELIGLANLADMSTTFALASLGTAKYSQVIDPISGDVVTSGTLVVGKGYWVFITSNGTLAGFSVTPVTWVAVP